MHENGVCHRDLKLENLLLLKPSSNKSNKLELPILKVSDFGLCGILSGKDHLFRTTLGSPNYVAPEVLNGQEYDGRKADIWSCGVILYCFLAKFLPFDEPDNNQRLFQRISTADIRYPSKFSYNVVDLLNHIIEVDPKRRFTVEQIRNHPWMKENGKIKVTRKNSTILMTYNQSKQLQQQQQEEEKQQQQQQPQQHKGTLSAFSTDDAKDNIINRNTITQAHAGNITPASRGGDQKMQFNDDWSEEVLTHTGSNEYSYDYNDNNDNDNENDIDDDVVAPMTRSYPRVYTPKSMPQRLPRIGTRMSNASNVSNVSGTSVNSKESKESKESKDDNKDSKENKENMTTVSNSTYTLTPKNTKSAGNSSDIIVRTLTGTKITKHRPKQQSLNIQIESFFPRDRNETIENDNDNDSGSERTSEFDSSASTPSMSPRGSPTPVSLSSPDLFLPVYYFLCWFCVFILWFSFRCNLFLFLSSVFFCVSCFCCFYIFTFLVLNFVLVYFFLFFLILGCCCFCF